MKADLRAWDRLYPPYIGGVFRANSVSSFDWYYPFCIPSSSLAAKGGGVFFAKFTTMLAAKREVGMQNGHHQSKDLVKVAYENPPYIGGVNPLLSSEIEFEGNAFFG